MQIAIHPPLNQRL